MTYEPELIAIDNIIDMIDNMRESGDFHNPTLDELEQRLM
jgi:hypothetical protein